MSTKTYVTANGRAKYNAASVGTPISIASFRIGNRASFVPADNATNVYLTGGGVVYPGNISQMSHRLLSNGNVVVTITLDTSVGDFTVGNIGLFLSDNTLFSLTVLDAPENKREQNFPTENGDVRTYDIVFTISSNPGAINFSLTEAVYTTLPTVATQAGLPPTASAPYDTYKVSNHTAIGKPVIATIDPDTNAWAYAPTYDDITDLNDYVKSIKVSQVINVPEDFANPQLALDSVKDFYITEKGLIQIKVNGPITYNGQITFRHPQSNRIQFLGGVANITPGFVSITSVSGASGNWEVVLRLVSVADIEIGHMAFITGASKTSNSFYVPTTNVISYSVVRGSPNNTMTMQVRRNTEAEVYMDTVTANNELIFIMGSTGIINGVTKTLPSASVAQYVITFTKPVVSLNSFSTNTSVVPIFLLCKRMAGTVSTSGLSATINGDGSVDFSGIEPDDILMVDGQSVKILTVDVPGKTLTINRRVDFGARNFGVVKSTHLHNGCWMVTDVNGTDNEITIKNTCLFSKPPTNVSAMSLTICPNVITTNSAGTLLKFQTLGIDKIENIGFYNSSNKAVGIGLAVDASSDDDPAKIVFGNNVGFSGFNTTIYMGGQGNIQAAGNFSVCNSSVAVMMGGSASATFNGGYCSFNGNVTGFYLKDFSTVNMFLGTVSGCTRAIYGYRGGGFTGTGLILSSCTYATELYIDSDMRLLNSLVMDNENYAIRNQGGNASAIHTVFLSNRYSAVYCTGFGNADLNDIMMLDNGANDDTSSALNSAHIHASGGGQITVTQAVLKGARARNIIAYGGAEIIGTSLAMFPVTPPEGYTQPFEDIRVYENSYALLNAVIRNYGTVTTIPAQVANPVSGVTAADGSICRLNFTNAAA